MVSEAIFLNGSVTASNPKALRAKLRKMGYSVREATKDGTTYTFNCNGPPQLSQATSKALLTVASEIKIVYEPKPQHRERFDTDSVEVLGKEIEPFDQIVNHFPKTLTVDKDGVSGITMPLPKHRSGPAHSFFGFHSMESASISSFKIDPDHTYQIRRVT